MGTVLIRFLMLLLSVGLLHCANLYAQNAAAEALPSASESVLKDMGVSPEKAKQVLEEMNIPAEVGRKLLASMQQSADATARTLLDQNIPPQQATDMLKRMGVSDARIESLLDTMGEAISREQKKRDSGWGDSQARMLMVLRDQDGNERQRKILIKTLEVPGDGSKSLSVFESPPDVRNTALLTETHINSPDNQWLYLPKLKRVKRISMLNKSSPFMGSEFSYEDMASFEVEKYKIRYLRDETLNGKPCYVVSMVPRYERSGYSKLVAYVEKQRYLAQRIDYYNQDQQLFKSMQLLDYQHFNNQFWRPTRLIMTNSSTGNSTSIEWQDYRFNTGLTENDFTTQALKRAG